MTERAIRYRRLATVVMLLAALLVCMQPTPARAQDDGDTPTTEQAQPPQRSAPAEDIPMMVWQFSIVWLLVFTVLLVLMMWLAYWMAADCKARGLNLDTWGAGMLGSILLVVFLLTMTGKPGMVLGLVGMLVPVGVLCSYLSARDKLVPDDQKILTSDGLKRISRRLLARIGIRSSSGPQISTSGIAVDGLVLLDGQRSPMEQAHRTAGIDKDLLYQAQQILVDLAQGRAETALVELRGDSVAVTAIRYRLISDYVVFPAEQGITLGRYYCTLLGGGQPLPAGAGGRFHVRPPGLEELIEVKGRLRQATDTTFRLDLVFEYDTPREPKLHEFGLLPRIQDQLAEALSNKPGLVVVSGPPNQGTGTTYYAMMSSIDGLTHDVVSFEQVVEREIPHSRQLPIKDKTLDELKRLIGEVAITGCDVAGFKNVTDLVRVNRREVMQLVLQQSLQTLVVARIEAPDSISALSQLITWGADPETLVNGLSLVVNQRLVGRLCDQCKKPVTVKPAILTRAGIPPETPGVQFHQKAGCRACLNSGYSGLTPVMETLVVDDAMKQVIRAGAAAEQVREVARRNGSLLFLQSGTLKAAAGLTAIKDVYKSLGLTS